MKETISKDTVFLIDGYPRNKDNIDGWNAVFDNSEGNKAKILCLLNLECSEETCVQRLKSRGTTSGRVDDDESVIKKRFNTYKNESVQVLDLMKDNHKIVNISSEGNVEDIFKNACLELEKFEDVKTR